jgi:hypothetical protein
VRLRRRIGRKPAKARPGKTTKSKRRDAPIAARQTSSSVSDLKNQVSALTRELVEVREQQTATSDILRVISQSPTDATPVFDANAERARVPCRPLIGATTRFDGELLHLVGYHGPSPQAEAGMPSSFPRKTFESWPSISMMRFDTASPRPRTDQSAANVHGKARYLLWSIASYSIK